MKKTFKFLWHLAFSLALIYLTYVSVFDQIRWVQNLIAFFTWTLFILSVILLFSKDGLKSWADDSVLPGWFNNFTYWSIFIIFACGGWFLFAAFWFIIWSITVYAAETYKKEKKS